MGGASETAEGATKATASRTTTDTSVVEVHPTAYVLRYADGPADAEAFCVHPRTGDGYILTKRLDGRAVVYKLPAPWNPREETLVPQLCTVELPASITGLARRCHGRRYFAGWPPPGGPLLRQWLGMAPAAWRH